MDTTPTQRDTCRWPDCDRDDIQGRNLCSMHYQRSYNLGEWDTPWVAWDARELLKAQKREQRRTAKCRWPECDNSVKTRGLCVKHYDRALVTGEMKTPWIAWDARQKLKVSAPKLTCQWPDCDRIEYARGLCAMDYKRAAALDEWDTPWDAWADRINSRNQTHQAECRWPDCTRVHSSHGLCTMHYSRARTADDFDKPWETWEAWKPRRGQESWRGQYTECRWPDCGDDISGRGLCKTHYQRARNVDEWDTPWEVWTPWPHSNECEWPECSNRGDVRGFCSKHYGRARDVNDFETPWVAWNEHNDCDFCGETTGSRVARYCSGGCAARNWQTENPEEWRAIKRMAGNRRHARKLATTTDHFTETDVIERYGSNCYLCARPVDFSVLYPDPDSPSLDHIIPLSKGGTHTLENCAMTHLLCNNKKQATVSDLRPTLLVK